MDLQWKSLTKNGNVHHLTSVYRIWEDLNLCFKSNFEKSNFVLYICASCHRDLNSCQVIASDKSNLLRKADFRLKGVFFFLVFFIPFEVRHLFTIFVNFLYKCSRQLFSEHHKIMTDWFIFLEYFSDWWFNQAFNQTGLNSLSSRKQKNFL